MIWVLDTSFLVDVQHRDPHALAAMGRLKEGAERILVPGQAVSEFLAGTEQTHLMLTLNRLRSAFTLVPTDESQMVEGGRLGRLAISRGIRPRWPDIQIGAVAMLHAAQVITANPKDFLALDIPAWNHRDGDAMPAAA